MPQRNTPDPPHPAAVHGRAARRQARALREAGERLVGAALRHLLDTMRRTERCAPWRSGRTAKDLERRSGLAVTEAPERAPLVAPLLERLLRDAVVERRAGHYRFAAGPPRRCPACGGVELHRNPAPDPPDDALGSVPRLHCAACGAWCGLALDPPAGAPPTPPDGARGVRRS